MALEAGLQRAADLLRPGVRGERGGGDGPSSLGVEARSRRMSW